MRGLRRWRCVVLACVLTVPSMGCQLIVDFDRSRIPGSDAGAQSDATVDSGADAALDAGVDGATDVSLDASVDAALDASTDAFVDAAVDASDAD